LRDILQPYSKEFFENQITAKDSIQEIIPVILQFVKPQSVVDVGCGIGVWLAQFREHGIQDFLGIDGDYINSSLLEIPVENFFPHDLKKPLTQLKKFDLVISIEVAEHIPIEFSDNFIQTLTNLGDVIVFSAAVPFQGGTFHVNEQWPAYWIKKFKEKGYDPIDCIRKNIWCNERVAGVYAQNLFFFVKRQVIDHYPNLQRECQELSDLQMYIIHPSLYLSKYNQYLFYKALIRNPIKLCLHYFKTIFLK
jgi:SAM-dependent methyltransferase